MFDTDNSSAKDIAKKLLELLAEPDMEDIAAEIAGVTVTEKQKSNVLEMVEQLLRLDPKLKQTTPELIRSFRVGVAYGMATGAKLGSQVMEEGGFQGAPKKLVSLMIALEKAADKWEDSTWYENLIKNAVITEEKNGTTKTVQDGRKKKKGAV